MEKIIWIMGFERTVMLDVQRKINSAGSMRALCMLSVDALKKTIEERLTDESISLVMPSAIVLDYERIKEEQEILKLLKENPRLAGVPLFFVLDEKDMDEEELCYKKGAMVVLKKPVTVGGIARIEHAAWQYEVTKKYERILQKQVSEIQAAKEIYYLNQQLESRNEFLHRIFGKYFSDDVLEVILEKPDGALIGGERRNVAILMADLRGFSSVAEELLAEEMTSLLNHFFGTMVEIIARFGGTVIEFMGDGLLAVFGAPVANDNFREAAIAAAIQMQNAMQKVNYYFTWKGHEALEMGIGIHCGEVFVGNVGSEKMMRYNVLGRAVNECSRIEGYSVGGQVLVSLEMLKYLTCNVDVAQKIEISAKGIKKRMTVCDVKGMEGNYACHIEKEYDETCVTKVTDEILLTLYTIHKKQITQDFVTARLKAFSAKMFFVELSDGEGNIKDELKEFTDVEIRAKSKEYLTGFEGVYAKIVKIEDTVLCLQFTHVNSQLKEFMLDLQIFGEGRSMIMDTEKKCEIEIIEATPEEMEAIKISGVDGTRKYGLYWSKEEDGIELLFLSGDKAVRALEFMEYLVSDYAMVHGEKNMAMASVSSTFLNVMLTDMEVQDIGSMLKKRTVMYYSECDWIYANSFLEKNREMILNLPIYVKKKLAWAYVKTTDVVNQGEKFAMKSLENESDIIMEASPDAYIMIGCRGEIYDIQREKFEKTYEATEEILDIYGQMLDFLPEVKTYPDGEYRSLDEIARLCYPRNDKGIYVARLNRRTKVFTPHNNGEYFVGREGDYLAIREDDLTDIYVIQREIFMQTYEEKECK